MVLQQKRKDSVFSGGEKSASQFTGWRNVGQP